LVFVLGIVAFVLGIGYVSLQLHSWSQWKWSYEEKVEDRVRYMVKPECLHPRIYR
jgi:hypothetical protein